VGGPVVAMNPAVLGDVMQEPVIVCGVVVTYHPTEDVAENVRAMVRECRVVVVVDNGSSEAELVTLKEVRGVTILRLGENLGVATALNRGATWAQEHGFAWCVAFDQDSRPAPGMVTTMWATHLRCPTAAVVGPVVHEEMAEVAGYRWVVQRPRFRWWFRRAACTNADLENVTMLISSGSLFDLAMWSRLEGFDDGLFIDYVDVDYCLKVLRAGRSIAVSAGAVLHHRLGNRRKVRVLGHEFRPMGHAAFRHYYMARNRCIMWRRHALAVPHWAMFDLAFGVLNITRVMAFEDARLSKICMMFRGMWDGLRGLRGPRPQRAKD
jgi:rhamnosyltransferase